MPNTPHPPAAPDTDLPQASVITCEVPGTFAWGVLHERHPALIRKIRDAFPLPAENLERLAALLEEATGGVVEPLGEHAHDHRSWQTWGMADHVGTPWSHLPFLWAESYFYRRLLEAWGYFAPGPWQGVDPFAPFKRAELFDTETTYEVQALDTLADLDPQERGNALLQSSVWGNRADLSFQILAKNADSPAQGSELVVDHSESLWELLDNRSGGQVCLVADNAGRELLPDLVLIDELLTTERASEVVLHIKSHPYYVSDATMVDVLDCLRHLCGAQGTAQRVGARLWRAMEQGRLHVRAHAFSCAPLPYRDMPEDLAEDFATACLTIMKGDLNYRRLVGDRYWPATTPFEAVTAYFPGPVVALRTLKSDVVVGLEQNTVTTLDDSGLEWRTSGTHALVQLRE